MRQIFMHTLNYLANAGGFAQISRQSLPLRKKEIYIHYLRRLYNRLFHICSFTWSSVIPIHTIFDDALNLNNLSLRKRAHFLYKLGNTSTRTTPFKSSNASSASVSPFGVIIFLIRVNMPTIQTSASL